MARRRSSDWGRPCETGPGPDPRGGRETDPAGACRRRRRPELQRVAGAGRPLECSDAERLPDRADARRRRQRPEVDERDCRSRGRRVPPCRTRRQTPHGSRTGREAPAAVDAAAPAAGMRTQIRGVAWRAVAARWRLPIQALRRGSGDAARRIASTAAPVRRDRAPAAGMDLAHDRLRAARWPGRALLPSSRFRPRGLAAILHCRWSRLRVRRARTVPARWAAAPDWQTPWRKCGDWGRRCHRPCAVCICPYFVSGRSGASGHAHPGDGETSRATRTADPGHAPAGSRRSSSGVCGWHHRERSDVQPWFWAPGFGGAWSRKPRAQSQGP